MDIPPSLRIADALTSARSHGIGTGIAVDKIEEAALELHKRWSEPHRGYHGITHLMDLLTRLPGLDTGSEQAQLILAILFHDVVYEPHRKDNEEASIEVLAKMDLARGKDFEAILRAILSTKTGKCSEPVGAALNRIDRAILDETDMANLLAYEHGIAKEYQFTSWANYQHERVKFLLAQTNPRLHELAEYVRHRRPTIGVYAGSFDPFHLGHQNILQKSRALFDKTIVAVGINPSKLSPGLTIRTSEIQDACPYFEVEPFEGLLTDYLKRVREYAEPVLIRGLRDGFDLQYELNQARFMEDIDPSIQIVYIACDRKYQHISSTNLRALHRVAPGKVTPYLP